MTFQAISYSGSETGNVDSQTIPRIFLTARTYQDASEMMLFHEPSISSLAFSSLLVLNRGPLKSNLVPSFYNEKGVSTRGMTVQHSKHPLEAH